MNKQLIDYSDFNRLPTRDIKHIPGDSGAPVLGDTLAFLADFPKLTANKYDRYGNVFRTRAFFQDTIVLLGPQANEAVLSDPNKCFSNRLAWNPTLEKIFPNGLMLRDFDDHKYHRKVLQAAFKKPAIERYIRLMSPHIQNGLQTWPQKSRFSFFDTVKHVLLNVGAQVFLGLDIQQSADKINEAFVNAVNASLAIVRVSLPGNTWMKGQQGRRYLEQFISRHIAEKRSSDQADIFTQICQARDDNNELLSNTAIIDHLIFLLFAAHDTTTSTLCSIVYALAKHQDWQDTLRDEIHQLQTTLTCDEAGLWQLDHDSLGLMEYTSLVFREALRMHPPLPSIPRRCINETEILGFRIPRNAGVGISPHFTHYMEEFWSSPQKFDPERFNKQRAEDKRHFFQFIPFGGGAHKCLGLNFAEIQAKIFLFHLLGSYRVSVDEGYEMKYSVVPIAFPSDGLPISISKLD